MLPVDAAQTLLPGPWRHEFVAAGGSRFHVALAGREDDPLVVLLHGYPQFWWAWREQIPALADAGYRVAAMDLRGSGASDRGPRGYDIFSLTRDVAGVIRSLGATTAVVAGQGIGGTIAWSLPALHPHVVTGIVALSAPHPLHVHARAMQLFTPAAKRQLAYAQLPHFPEKSLVSRGMVAKVLRGWGSPGWCDDETVGVYSQAMQIPFAPHSAMEIIRWQVRSTWRSDGKRYLSALKSALPVRALQLHGNADGAMRVGEAFAERDLARFQVIDGAGHFLSEEAPDDVTAALQSFL